MQKSKNTVKPEEHQYTSSGSSFEENPSLDGLPEKISTEAQLWDEILKKEVLEMPFLLLPLVKEIHGKSYPRDVKIIPLGTEFSIERTITKDISSIRSDIAVRIESGIYHFECESDTDKIIVKRVYEYDSQSALAYSEEGTKAIPYILHFPYSAVLFLEPETTTPSRLACELHLPVYSSNRSDAQKTDPWDEQNTNTEIKCIDYAVPALKVQDYTLSEIGEKNLLILIPFTPIRFRTMLRKKKHLEKMKDDGTQSPPPHFNYDSAKLELTNYFQKVILILDKAVASGYITELDRKDILALLRKALIRVFHEDKFLLGVVNHMTAPVLELERETIVRLQKELEAQRPALELERETVARLQKELEAQRPALELERETAARLQKELDIAKAENKNIAAENKILRNRLSRQKKRKRK